MKSVITLVAVALLAVGSLLGMSGCSDRSAITESQATGLREEIASLQTRLIEVESMLSMARRSGLSDEAEQTVVAATEAVATVITVLDTVRLSIGPSSLEVESAAPRPAPDRDSM